MNCRERVTTALRHMQPDRCPVDFWAVPEVVSRLCGHFNVSCEEDLYDIFETDLQFVSPVSTLPPFEKLSDGSFFDEMGVHRRPVKNEYCTYDEYASSPLEFVEDIADFSRYKNWPDAAAYDWAHFKEQISAQHEKRFTKLYAGGIFEYAWALRGYQQFMMDMLLQPEIAHFIMDKLCQYWCDYIRFALDAAGDMIDLVYTYDDIASQTNLLMRPDMLETFIYPYHRKIDKLVKGYGKYIMYHSCGAIAPEIDSIAALPVDVLNPLQPMATGMDFEAIKRKHGEKLSFHGGICIQSTLPKGTPEMVREAVRRAITILGRNGGYIMSSAHYIQNDTPTENIIALYDTSIR